MHTKIASEAKCLHSLVRGGSGSFLGSPLFSLHRLLELLFIQALVLELADLFFSPALLYLYGFLEFFFMLGQCSLSLRRNECGQFLLGHRGYIDDWYWTPFGPFVSA